MDTLFTYATLDDHPAANRELERLHERLDRVVRLARELDALLPENKRLFVETKIAEKVREIRRAAEGG